MPRIHETLSGHRIEYDPEPKVERFLKRVDELVDDSKATEDDVIALVYGKENPILDQTLFPARGAVTREVLENPVYQVMTDLLARKRVQQDGLDVAKLAARYTLTVQEAAEELGISPDAVRKAIAARRLPAWSKEGAWYLDPRTFEALGPVGQRGPAPAPRGPGMLECIAGSTSKEFFLVKAPGYDDPIGTGKEVVHKTVRPWKRAAILMGGGGKLRMFVLERFTGDRSSADEVPFREWKASGHFNIVEKINNARDARLAWDSFQPS
jgi:excisionase family DNA binding protein